MTLQRLSARARPWFRRLAATLMAAGFLGTATADAYGVHRCPHHDGLPGADTPFASHGAHDAGAHDGGAQSGTHDDHGPCTCVGACDVTGAAMPVPATAHTSIGGATGSTLRALPPADHTPHHFAYLLPFANAPPSMS
jgi:hypothetical protein